MYWILLRQSTSYAMMAMLDIQCGLVLVCSCLREVGSYRLYVPTFCVYRFGGSDIAVLQDVCEMDFWIRSHCQIW